jgi:hypothetical protein
VWVTVAMFAWLLLHVVIGAFYRPIRQGRKVAYLTLVSFVFLVIALVGMFLTTKHGGIAERSAANEVLKVWSLRSRISICGYSIANCEPSGGPA